MVCTTVSYGRVSGKAKKYPYFQTCIYEAYQTKDFRNVWKLKSIHGRAHRSYSLTESEAKDLAKELNCEYMSNIRQWKEIK